MGRERVQKSTSVKLGANHRGVTMSLTLFQRRIRGASLGKAERTWFPKWIDGYRRHCRMELDQDLPVTESLVIGFLRSLRDNRIAAWRRLQAARAIELYQEIVPCYESQHSGCLLYTSPSPRDRG